VKKRNQYSGGDECPAVGNSDFYAYLVYQPELTEQHTEHIATPPTKCSLAELQTHFNCRGRLTLNLQTWFVDKLTVVVDAWSQARDRP